MNTRVLSMNKWKCTNLFVNRGCKKNPHKQINKHKTHINREERIAEVSNCESSKHVSTARDGEDPTNFNWKGAFVYLLETFEFTKANSDRNFWKMKRFCDIQTLKIKIPSSVRQFQIHYGYQQLRESRCYCPNKLPYWEKSEVNVLGCPTSNSVSSSAI